MEDRASEAGAKCFSSFIHGSPSRRFVVWLTELEGQQLANPWQQQVNRKNEVDYTKKNPASAGDSGLDHKDCNAPCSKGGAKKKNI